MTARRQPLVLCRRTPAQWALAIVAATPDPALRHRVAAICWWDYYGGRLCNPELPATALDALRLADVPGEVVQAELEAALAAAGYPAGEARRRAVPANVQSGVAVTTPK